jgi:hypothetical protein
VAILEINVLLIGEFQGGHGSSLLSDEGRSASPRPKMATPPGHLLPESLQAKEPTKWVQLIPPRVMSHERMSIRSYCQAQRGGAGGDEAADMHKTLPGQECGIEDCIYGRATTGRRNSSSSMKLILPLHQTMNISGTRNCTSGFHRLTCDPRGTCLAMLRQDRTFQHEPGTKQGLQTNQC